MSSKDVEPKKEENEEAAKTAETSKDSSKEENEKDGTSEEEPPKDSFWDGTQMAFHYVTLGLVPKPKSHQNDKKDAMDKVEEKVVKDVKEFSGEVKHPVHDGDFPSDHIRYNEGSIVGNQGN